MSIENHKAFLDSLEPEKGLPEEMHGWRFDEKLQPFDRTMFYEDGIIKSSTVEYLIERIRRAESRQIPDLKERVKKFVDAAMEAEGRFWRSSKAAYIDAERGLFRALCAPEVKP